MKKEMKNKKIENEIKISNITQKWVDVLIPFCNDYSARFTASTISKKSKIPQQSVSRILNNLIKFNLVNYITEGKNKLFYFDLRNKNSLIVLNILENYKALNFKLSVKNAGIFINDVLEHCDGLIIFGSYASGKHDKNSDLDIVFFGGKKDKIKEIIEIYNFDVHGHYVNFSEFNKILKQRNTLAIEIMHNHVLFGDVSKIVNIFWRWFYDRR